MNTSLMRNKRGFSLIELLVIVAIIGVLVGVATPYLLDYIKESKIAKAEEDLDVLVQALILHDSQEATPFAAADFRPLIGTYLNEDPPRDPWGNTYRVDSNLGMIKCFGPDQQSSSMNPDSTGTISSVQLDDVVARYLPPLRLVGVEIDITRGNLADTRDAGDLVYATFSKGIDTTSMTAAHWRSAAHAMSNIFMCYGDAGNTWNTSASYNTFGTLALSGWFTASAYTDNNRTVRLTLASAASTLETGGSAFTVGDSYWLTSCITTTDVTGKPTSSTSITANLVTKPFNDTKNFHEERPLVLTTSSVAGQEAYMVPLKYR